VIFRAARRMIQDLNPDRNQQDWVLEIGVCPTVSRTLATRALLPVFDLNNVFPRVRFGAYRDLLEDLLTGELDLLLSENEPPHTHRARIGVRAVSESPLVIVAAPELAARVADFPRGLSGIPMATYTRSSRYRWEMDSFIFEHGLTPEVIGEADDVSLLAQLAKRGRCAVAVPEAVARAALDSQALVRLGPVSETPTVVYAHYAEANTAGLVQQALEALIAAGS
jgi:DNA-binding transcriptional LysR family regulator